MTFRSPGCFDVLWNFETANFRVSLLATPCHDDPADTMCDDRDIAAVRNGEVAWFDACAKVEVRVPDDRRGDSWREVACDWLGCCAYTTQDEFVSSHRDPDPMNRNCSIMRAARGSNVVICHYFPSMVAEAIKAARQSFDSLRGVQLRKAS